MTGSPKSPRCKVLPFDLMAKVSELKARHQIVGTPPTLEELLNPVEGREIGRGAAETSLALVGHLRKFCGQLRRDDVLNVKVDLAHYWGGVTDVATLATVSIPTYRLLTRICRDWRTLAFSTPALWDTIVEIEVGVYPHVKTVVETWFSRAGTRPLSLAIICPQSLDSAFLESVILQHASQMQSLDMTTNSRVLCDFTPVQSLPILSNLMLYRIDDYDDDEPHIQLFRIRGAPALRHLLLERVGPSTVIRP
ncbi:hypothetical protein K438DRAFT_1749762 [Mycena galopus ATCC 62051]|nr:hypothetical protein K438DRAFT_1749762 [Mycena galopus ATCC 62051]